jgi:hypothetical protein
LSTVTTETTIAIRTTRTTVATGTTVDARRRGREPGTTIATVTTSGHIHSCRTIGTISSAWTTRTRSTTDTARSRNSGIATSTTVATIRVHRITGSTVTTITGNSGRATDTTRATITVAAGAVRRRARGTAGSTDATCATVTASTAGTTRFARVYSVDSCHTEATGATVTADTTGTTVTTDTAQRTTGAALTTGTTGYTVSAVTTEEDLVIVVDTVRTGHADATSPTVAVETRVATVTTECTRATIAEQGTTIASVATGGFGAGQFVEREAVTKRSRRVGILGRAVSNQRLTAALRQVDDETITHKGGVVADARNEWFVRCQPCRSRVETGDRDRNRRGHWHAINGRGLRGVGSQCKSAERQRDHGDRTQAHVARKTRDEEPDDHHQDTDDEERHEPAPGTGGGEEAEVARHRGSFRRRGLACSPPYGGFRCRDRTPKSQ